MLAFDHIAIATTDLATGRAEIEAALGVPLENGGKHVHFGTHNTLLNLGDLYLEVIAKDPDAAPTGRATWFDLDNFIGPTRPANWICRTPSFDLAPSECGPPVALTRDALRWQLTVPDTGRLPMQGAYPSLMKWGDGITPPSGALPDRGCRLETWTVFHPEAAEIASKVPLDDPRVHFETAATASFRAVIETPNGKITLG